MWACDHRYIHDDGVGYGALSQVRCVLCCSPLLEDHYIEENQKPKRIQQITVEKSPHVTFAL